MLHFEWICSTSFNKSVLSNYRHIPMNNGSTVVEALPNHRHSITQKHQKCTFSPRCCCLSDNISCGNSKSVLMTTLQMSPSQKKQKSYCSFTSCPIMISFRGGKSVSNEISMSSPSPYLICLGSYPWPWCMASQ